ncbi:MAG: anaerobic ribonucleoside-triphosphate reductase activating protein [Clostridia bacterium]|nr:anaerobic ribonucleoside-triphosphate reductase activating protein [Clostridia bacterium]MBQ8600305.1 anaerobic ribonucleoside-triphosphate reductase activating protein [Clostridia bacterium]
MTIAGLQKLTLLDFPGKTACTVFLNGCNFRCPFCHNFALAKGLAEPLMGEEELLSFLESRKGLLDGVCFTGGEPLMQRELPELIRKIKAMDYAVKLDTNGSFPERLKALAEEGLLDYVAMDVKNAPERYGETAGFLKLDLKAIKESIEFLKSGAVDYEFRTTVVNEFHGESELREIAKWLQGTKRYFLQQFKPSEQVPKALTAPTYAEMHDYLKAVREILPAAELRGVD